MISSTFLNTICALVILTLLASSQSKKLTISLEPSESFQSQLMCYDCFPLEVVTPEPTNQGCAKSCDNCDVVCGGTFVTDLSDHHAIEFEILPGNDDEIVLQTLAIDPRVLIEFMAFVPNCTVDTMLLSKKIKKDKLLIESNVTDTSELYANFDQKVGVQEPIAHSISQSSRRRPRIFRLVTAT